MTVSAGAGLTVDELHSALLQRPQGGLEIGNTVGDVMEPGPPLRQETADGGVGRERLEELQLAVSGADETDINALGRDALARGTAGTCHGFEGRKGVVDGRDGDGDVVEGETPERVIGAGGVVGQGRLGQEIALIREWKQYG